MKPRNFPGRANDRRRSALDRIVEQLKRGSKRAKRSHPLHRRETPLDAADIKRLQNESDRLALLVCADERARAIRTKKTKALGWSAARAAYRSGRLA